MAIEVSRDALELTMKQHPMWVGRVRCCPNGCERYCVGSDKADVERWTRDTAWEEEMFHRCSRPTTTA